MSKAWQALAAAVLLCALAPCAPCGAADENGGGAASPRQASPHLLRDPFWPTGWTPRDFGRAEVDADQEALMQWEQARRRLQISGLSRGANGKYVAIVKDVGVVEEGDTVSVDYGGLTYRWRVRTITAQGIVPERLSASPGK